MFGFKGQIEKMGTYDDLSTELAHVAPDNNMEESPEHTAEPEIVRKRLMSLQSNTVSIACQHFTIFVWCCTLRTLSFSRRVQT